MRLDLKSTGQKVGPKLTVQTLNSVSKRYGGGEGGGGGGGPYPVVRAADLKSGGPGFKARLSLPVGIFNMFSSI